MGKLAHKIHLDGSNLLPYLPGQEKKGPRKSFFYFSDDGDLLGLRYDNWKLVFAQQRMAGTMGVLAEPFLNTRIPYVFNLRTAPYEKATITSNTCWVWIIDHAFLLVPAQRYVGQFLMPFKEYPPHQKAASFTVNQAPEMLRRGAGGQ